MGNPRRYAGNLKTIVLAGAMALFAINGFAQQEVNPDHFDEIPPTAASKQVGKSRKQPATPSTNSVSKRPVRQAKASKNTGSPRVVTVAAH
jgi:hypothetical protein